METCTGTEVPKVLVAHSCAVIASGLVSMLSRSPCVRVTSLAADQQSEVLDADIVVADASWLSAFKTTSKMRPGRHAPKMVLVTGLDCSGGAPPPIDVACRIPATCGEQELFDMMRALSLGDQPRPQARGGLAPGALRRVREHVESSLAERIEIQSLADLAKLSVCHFSRAFRQSVGVSPHHYVLRRRIDRALSLIRDGDQPLAEIAFSVGFSDQSHFTRTFVQMTGETPSGFRHRHR